MAWSWETAVARLCERALVLGGPVRRSCRPMAAERRSDGRLTLVLGCWWPPDLHVLTQPAQLGRLDSALSEFLDDQVRCQVVAWPAGMAPPCPGPEPDEVDAPSLLGDLPPEALEAARGCESALQRLFFARCWALGLRLNCQYQVASFRLDFALPGQQVGAEILGWDGPRPGRTARWEREQQLGAESWRILYFSGAEVYRDVGRCAQDLAEAAGARTRR